MPDPHKEGPEGPKSGRLLVRMPGSLHEAVAHAARAEAVSMNTYICTVLAGAVEWRSRELSEREARQARRGIEFDLWLGRHG